MRWQRLGFYVTEHASFNQEIHMLDPPRGSVIHSLP